MILQINPTYANLAVVRLYNNNCHVCFCCNLYSPAAKGIEKNESQNMKEDTML